MCNKSICLPFYVQKLVEKHNCKKYLKLSFIYSDLFCLQLVKERCASFYTYIQIRYKNRQHIVKRKRRKRPCIASIAAVVYVHTLVICMSEMYVCKSMQFYLYTLLQVLSAANRFEAIATSQKNWHLMQSF